MQTRPLFPLAALVLGSALSSSFARADDPRASAQALFDDGVKRMNEHAYDVACPKLEEVVHLQPAKIGAIMVLARCYEESGKLASAWARYLTAADVAHTAGDAREAKAQAKADAIAARVPKLVVTVAPANKKTQGFSVQRDGADLSAAQWDTPLPIDAGKHVIVAVAAGKTPWTREIDVQSGAPSKVEVPELKTAGATTPPAAVPLAPVASSPAAAPPKDSAHHRSRVPAIIGFGVGGAGLVLGAVTGGLALGKASSIKTNCDPGGHCLASDQSNGNSASTLATISDIGFIAGGVGVAFGLAYVLWPDKNSANSAVVVSPGLGSITMKGAF